jgi:hypothetical protein
MSVEQTYGLTVRATGEVRDTEGNLIETVHAEEDPGVEVTLGQLRDAVARHQTTDDQMRQLGFSEELIKEIRS